MTFLKKNLQVSIASFSTVNCLPVQFLANKNSLTNTIEVGECEKKLCQKKFLFVFKKNEKKKGKLYYRVSISNYLKKNDQIILFETQSKYLIKKVAAGV